MTRLALLAATGAVLLSACATAPSQRPSAAEPTLSHDVAVDVVLDGQRVGGGQGTWLDAGLVLTTLDAVNDVPPTGELIVRAANGTRLSASLWTAGNPNDANAAYLFIHHPERFGALAELPAQALCASTPSELLAAHPGEPAPAALAIDRFSGTDVSLTGTVVRDPAGCIAGLVSVFEERVTLVPLEALQLVANALPPR